jgi:hypothetical protein
MIPQLSETIGAAATINPVVAKIVNNYRDNYQQHYQKINNFYPFLKVFGMVGC